MSELMEGAEPTFSPGEAAGVLLLHDLAGTPHTMQHLARALSEVGFAVDVPLLPGHGTKIDDLEPMTWDDWAGAAQLGLDELASRAGQVVVGGMGMGATLGCWVAAQHPQVVGVVAINPWVAPLPDAVFEMFEAMIKDGTKVMPPLGNDISDRTARVVAYESMPVATLISMFEAVNSMADHWQELKTPILAVSSARDHRVDPRNVDWLSEHAAGEVERLWLPHSFHIATLDVDHEDLERSFIDFATRRTSV